MSKCNQAKKEFTTTKSVRSLHLSIIVKEIIQLPKTMGPKRNIVLALQKREKRKKKHKKLLLNRDKVYRGVIAASSITSTTSVASSVTFSAVASEG